MSLGQPDLGAPRSRYSSALKAGVGSIVAARQAGLRTAEQPKDSEGQHGQQQ